jgi:hypothetical protein
MGVAVDWKLEARLKEEYRSEKDDNDAIDALRMLGVLATEDDKRWFGEHPDRRAYVRMIVQEETDIFPFRKLTLEENLVVVMRIPAKDLHPYYPPEIVRAVVEAGHMFVVREPFHVDDLLEDLDQYRRWETLNGPDIFDRLLCSWVRTNPAPHMQA